MSEKLMHVRIWGEIPLYSWVKRNRGIVYNVHENYQKRTSRNRYKIMSSNGIQTLSIPLIKGKNSQTNIMDVKIAYHDNWVGQHLNAIKTSYGKSAYFEHYFPHVENLYMQKLDTLYTLNTASVDLCLKWLSMESKITQSPEYSTNEELDNLETKTYPQVFEYKHGFMSGCCILDLIFCMGPEAILYI